MGYNCHNFCNGQILDAEALNEMENGILNSIRHTKQTLTPEQQAQARENIGAAAIGEGGGSPSVCEAKGEVITVANSSKDNLCGLKLFGKSTQNGTPTQAAPVDIVSVGSSGAINVTVAGKNLLEHKATTKTVNGLTFTANGDGSVTVNGTATAYTQENTGIADLPGGHSYTMTGCATGGASNKYWLNVYIGATDPKTDKRDYGSGVIFERSEKTYSYVRIHVAAGVTMQNVVFRPMIRLTSVVDEVYEQSKGLQKITVSTPHGLRGIAVSSGGNYTDEKGQQWVCDEKDLARGEHVQRIGVIDNYNNEDISGAYMSTTGELSKGATVLYVLEPPIVTALPVAEIEAFKELHSNKPNTTVFNDSGAHMSLEYNAYTNTSQVSADMSASYYQKGNSEKTFSKKIGIIAAGQSNIDGRAPYANMPSEIKTAMPMANCHYVKNSVSGAFSSINITGQWGFDLVTYFNICKNANTELYVIKWSQGGTSIDPDGCDDGVIDGHWSADYEKVLANGAISLLRNFEDSIRNHVKSDGNNFDIRAFIWHQGEADRNLPDNYYENLKYMLAYVRGVVGNKNLPFITGTINRNSTMYSKGVEDAQIRLAAEDPNFHLIDMSGAPLLNDSLHFNAVANKYFGEKVYDCLIDIGVVSGEKLNPAKPW